MSNNEENSAAGWPRSIAWNLPASKTNTAKETRARFEYQDECIALVVLDSLGDQSLDGILVEHSTDLVFVPIHDSPILVIIKHRESNQGGESSWTSSPLRKSKVLQDLYNEWVRSGRRCNVAFISNAGFTGPAYKLWRVCALGETEDKREVERAFGRDSAWGTWVNRWTAEEGRHAFCIHDYLLVTRGVDPEELERARMQTMEIGFDSGDKPCSTSAPTCRSRSWPPGSLIATPGATPRTRSPRSCSPAWRWTRTCTHDLLPQPGDGRFGACAEPDDARDHRRGRHIPDAGQHHPRLRRKAVQIALAGIYDLRVHHDDVVLPLVRQWGVLDLDGLDAEGEPASS